MELATPTIHKSGNSLHVSHGDDRGLFVTFYNEAVQSPFKSEEAGHPVFDDVPYIHIMFPGNSTTQVRRPVKLKQGEDGAPSDPQRWPKQWQAFKSQSEQVHSGIPITEWPPITKSQALALKGIHIHTVEALAEVPDNGLTWLGAREMQQKAIAWLKNADGGAEVLRLTKENEDLRTDIDMLKAQVSQLMAASKTSKAGPKAAQKEDHE